MKRFLVIFVCFSLSIFLLGCSPDKNSRTSPGRPVLLTVWHYYNGVQKLAFDELVTEFNETEGLKKGIAVEAFSQGNIDDLERKVIESINGKIGAEPMPDMFTAYADNAYQIDKLGFATDIGDYLTEQEIKEYIDSFISEGNFNGKNEIKIFPTAKATEIMMLNKTDWDKFALGTGASLDNLKTWEGVAETAKRYYEWTDSLTLTPNDGKAFFGRDAMANYMLVGSKQLGSEIFNVKNGQAYLTINDAVMRKLWDNFYIPYINGYYKAVGKFRSDDAKTGEIIALVCSTSGITYFPDTVVINDSTEYPIESLTLPLPNFKDTYPCAVQQGAGIVVTKSNEIKESASVEFLKWFTKKDNNIRFSIQSGYIPVKKESIERKIMEEFLSADKDNKASNKLKAALPTIISQIQTYELYTTKPFENGTDARKVLEKSLLDKSKIDREKVVQLIEEGRSRETAVKQFATDKNFNEWLRGLKIELEDAIKK